MNVDRAINIEDLRRMARRRLPRIAFDFIEGGVEDEDGLARNESAFARRRLMPRYLVDVSRCDRSATLFERTYANPFGIAPTGLAALFRPGADLTLAEAAVEADIPFVMSGAATASLEAAARIAPAHAWYQLYPSRDKPIARDLVRRARDAGLSTLVVTVDVPAPPKRERNIRSGFGQPLKLQLSSLATISQALTHPSWLTDYLRHGMPRLENWAPYTEPGADAQALAAFVTKQMHTSASWDDLTEIRRLWPRHLVLKGILRPDDAVRAAEAGVDGIIVSNHGGRQLDRAPAPIEVLPAIHAAVGDKVTLMLDSGVRRGADIVAALCLGARFVFVGRATLYGVAAGGLAGARKAIRILSEEVEGIMVQIGCPSLRELNPEFLMRDGGF